MGLLSKTVKTTSYQSWGDIDGNAILLVQRRTDSGLSKNRSALHQIAYGAPDLFPFRILLLSGTCAGLAFNPHAPKGDHEGDVRMKDCGKHVVAVAQSRAEIMKDWSEIKAHTDPMAITPDAWAETYKLIQFQRRHGLDGRSDSGSTAATAQAASPQSPLRGASTSTPRDEASLSDLMPGGSSSPPLSSSTPMAASPTSASAPKFIDAVAAPVAAAAVAGSPAVVAATPAATETEEAELLVKDTPTLSALEKGLDEPASPAEVWVHRVGRVFDGSSFVAPFLVVLLLGAAIYFGVASWWVAVTVPPLIGSLMPLDKTLASSDARLNREMRQLRSAPMFVLLLNRQRAANTASTLVVVLFSLRIFFGISLADYGHWACGATAAFTVLCLLRSFALEKRQAWHERLERMENEAIKAATDAIQQARADEARDEAVMRQTEQAAAAVAAAAKSVAPIANRSFTKTPATGAIGGYLHLDHMPTLKELPHDVQLTLDLMANNKWSKPTVYAGGVSVRMQTVPWSKAPAAKFTLSFPNVRALTVYGVVYDDPYGVKGKKSFAYQIEPLLADRRLIKRVADNEAYWYSAMNSSVPGIAGRDFVNRATPLTLLGPDVRAKYGMPEKGGALAYVGMPWEGPDAPPPNPPFVRAIMHRYGVIVQDWADGVGCDMTVIVSVDPKGYVPAVATSFVNKDTARKLRSMDSLLRRLQQEHGAPPALPLVLAPTAAAAAASQAQSTAAASSTAAVVAPVATKAAAPPATPTATDAATTPISVSKAFALINEGGWLARKEKDGFKWVAKAVPYAQSEANLWTGFSPGVHAGTVEAVLDDDPKLVKGNASYAYKFDELLLTRTHHGTDPTIPGSRRVLAQFKSPIFGVTARDFATRQLSYYLTEAEKVLFKIGSPGAPVYVFAAVNDDTIPTSSKFVRGNQHVYAYIAVERPDGSGCDISIVSATDLGGKLPLSIVNGSAAAQLDKLMLQVKIFREHEATHGAPPPRVAPAEAAPAKAAAPVEEAAPPATSQAPHGRLLVPRPGPLPEPFNKAITLWRTEGWKEKAQREGAVQKTVASPWCPKDALWMSVHVPGAILEDVDVALNDNSTTLRPDQAPFKYDRLLDKKNVLPNAPPDDRSFYLHSMFKTPMRLIAPRDTVTLLYWREFLTPEHQSNLRDLFVSSTGRVMCAAAVDGSHLKPVESPFARGTTHVFSLWAVEQKTGVDLNIVMSFDPCGSVPASLVNAANAEQLEKIVLMRSLTAAARDRRQ